MNNICNRWTQVYVSATPHSDLSYAFTPLPLTPGMSHAKFYQPYGRELNMITSVVPSAALMSEAKDRGDTQPRTGVVQMRTKTIQIVAAHSLLKCFMGVIFRLTNHVHCASCTVNTLQRFEMICRQVQRPGAPTRFHFTFHMRSCPVKSFLFSFTLHCGVSVKNSTGTWRSQLDCPSACIVGLSLTVFPAQIRMPWLSRHGLSQITPTMVPCHQRADAVCQAHSKSRRHTTAFTSCVFLSLIFQGQPGHLESVYRQP